MKTLMQNGFQRGIITFNELSIFFRWYYNCGFKLLLETNVKETEIQQQFYQNENQDNWKSPDFLKNLKEKKKKINEFREGL